MNPKLRKVLNDAMVYAIELDRIAGHTNHYPELIGHVDTINEIFIEAAKTNSPLAISESGAHSSGVSDRDELRESMCHLTHALHDMKVELVRTTEGLRSLSLVLVKLDLGTEKITMKVSELSGSLTEVKTTTLKAFSEIRNRIDAADARIIALEKGLSDADIPEEAANALADLKLISKQLDDIVPDTAELPPTPPVTPV